MEALQPAITHQSMLEDYAYKKIKTKHNHYCLTQIPQFALLAALIWHQALLLALETPIPDLQFCLYHLYSCVSRIQLKVCGTLKKIFLINKTRSWFFESINKISKPLARLTKKKKDNPNKIRNEAVEVTTNIAEIPKNLENTINNYIPTNLTT